MEKPRFLYHGSGRRGIKVFKPHQLHVRDTHEGPVIFATEHSAMASMFMTPRMDNSWTTIGMIDDVYHILISDEKRFREGDKGGSIYTLSSDLFYQDLTLGMKTEWVSKKEIVPVNEIEYESTYKAMIQNHVKVFFCTREDLEEFKALNTKQKIEMMNVLPIGK